MCLNAASGKIIWRVIVGTPLTSGVSGNDSIIVVVGQKGIIYAFDKNGNLRWKTRTSSNVLSPPAVNVNLVIVQSIDGRIAAYDARNGVLRWRFLCKFSNLMLNIALNIVLDSQTAYIGLPRGILLALALDTGEIRWEVVVSDVHGVTEFEQITDVSGISLFMGASNICACTFHGKIGCFNIKTGNVIWQKSFSSSINIGANPSFMFIVGEDGVITKLARKTGKLIWNSSVLQHRYLSKPIIIKDTVVIGDDLGCINFLSLQNGSLVACVRTDNSSIKVNPILVGQIVFFQTQSGTLIALVLE